MGQRKYYVDDGFGPECFIDSPIVDAVQTMPVNFVNSVASFKTLNDLLP